MIFKRMQNLFAARSAVARVAINMRPVHGPWGGASVFIRQFSEALTAFGFAVQYTLDPAPDIAFIIDPRDKEQYRTFGVDAVRECRKKNPALKVLHRVNECDKRKGTDFMDDILRVMSEETDMTVFISEWLRDYFAERWFDPARPHAVIYNGSDPRFFHPVGNVPWNGKEPMRVVTHHWSNNEMKGFPVYEELDRLLDAGELEGFEFTVIGRWPERIKWRAAETHEPCHDQRLGDLLRGQHLYLTASLWEPCGAHHVEGAQCGLPLVYHEDGGGIVEAGKRYGIGFRSDLKAALLQARSRYAGLRRRLLENPPSGTLMCLEYVRVIHAMLAGVDLAQLKREGGRQAG